MVSLSEEGRERISFEFRRTLEGMGDEDEVYAVILVKASDSEEGITERGPNFERLVRYVAENGFSLQNIQSSRDIGVGMGDLSKRLIYGLAEQAYVELIDRDCNWVNDLYRAGD